jgi:hypothetical protein
MKKRNWQLLSVVAMGGVVACSSSNAPAPGGDTTPAPNGGSAQLGDHTTVLDATKAGDVTVKADHLELPAATHADMLQRAVGDVLVGDKGGAGNPYGFLRKVSGAPTQQGAVIVVPTTAATLQDAVKQAKFQATLQAPQLTATGPVTASAPIHPLAAGGTTIKLLDFSGTKLLDQSGSATLASGHTVGYQAHATVTTGTLSFSPSFDVGADIEPNFSDPPASLKEFHAIAQGQLDGDLELDVGV